MDSANEIKVEVADNWWRRFRGLSGRDVLGELDGMIFKFPWPARWKMCMRGMKFPLDFVWIRKNKVIGVSENISSGTITPPERVDSVLELTANRARELNILVGTSLSLDGRGPGRGWQLPSPLNPPPIEGGGD